MKPGINLCLALLFFVGSACNKEKTSPLENDFREKYTGTYMCLLKSSKVVYDSLGNNQKKEDSSVVFVAVKKSENANGLIMTDATSKELISEVFFDSEPNFSASRIHGYFFKSDSLYIDNSHPILIYSTIYKGKKIHN